MPAKMEPAAIPLVTVEEIPANQQGKSKDSSSLIAKQRLQQALGLLQLFYSNMVSKEGSRSQQNHRTVDSPAYSHREQGVIEFIFNNLRIEASSFLLYSRLCTTSECKNKL